MHRALAVLGAALVSAVAAAQQPPTLTPSHPTAIVVTPTSAPAGLARTAIQGNALSALGAPLPNATIRLRDVRSGRVVDTMITDKAGLFVFRRVEPGSYIVELVGHDQTVLAASQILNVNAGNLASTIVKLPFRIPVAGLLSRSAPAVIAVAAAGAAAGVLASTATGQPVSPVR